jgi:hypothetical protein
MKIRHKLCSSKKEKTTHVFKHDLNTEFPVVNVYYTNKSGVRCLMPYLALAIVDANTIRIELSEKCRIIAVVLAFN